MATSGLTASLFATSMWPLCNTAACGTFWTLW